MYSRTYWVDHALSETNKFKITQVSGDVHTIVPYGTVMQQGVPQDAAHFNNIEEALSAHEIALGLHSNALMQHMDEIKKNAALAEVVDKLHTVETGTVTLTNSAKYPFNNSQKTVALAAQRNTPAYVVITEAKSFVGNVGEIVVSDILANGFKIAFTGSATSVTVEYKILGGYTR
ncbi:MAG: hypothetical protein IJV73_00385 [Clostridia bacterium]|nr:hypothetical protein [Clostridia bacterium]